MWSQLGSIVVLTLGVLALIEVAVGDTHHETTGRLIIGCIFTPVSIYGLRRNWNKSSRPNS